MNAVQLFNKAERELKSKNFKESVKLYSQAISIDSQNAHYISQRAVAFFHLGKLAEALYDFNHALELEPENPFRYSSRAFLLSNMKKLDEAIKDYEKAIELDPADSVAHNNLGLLQEQVGFDELAKQSFAKADKIEGIELISQHSHLKSPPKPILSTEPFNDSSETVTQEKEKKQYQKMSYPRFVRLVFTDKNVRKDFFRFIFNGFKMK